MTDFTTRDQQGNLVPELAQWLTGKREADRLGLELSGTEEQELGRALVEHGPPTDPAKLAELIDQVRDRNQLQRRVLETAPETSTTPTPEVLDLGETRGLGDGHLSSAQREQTGTPDRNVKIEDFLKESRDKYDDWS
jgi:hypothetical protein